MKLKCIQHKKNLVCGIRLYWDFVSVNKKNWKSWVETMSFFFCTKQTKPWHKVAKLDPTIRIELVLHGQRGYLRDNFAKPEKRNIFFFLLKLSVLFTFRLRHFLSFWLPFLSLFFPAYFYNLLYWSVYEILPFIQFQSLFFPYFLPNM